MTTRNSTITRANFLKTYSFPNRGESRYEVLNKSAEKKQSDTGTFLKSTGLLEERLIEKKRISPSYKSSKENATSQSNIDLALKKYKTM